MARKLSMAGIGLLVMVAGLLIAGEWSLHRQSYEVCNICSRRINPQAGVIAEIGSRRERVCCAHCVVTEGIQEHKRVRLIEVTDYSSGRKLDPRGAWYVEGSRIEACAHDMTRMNEMKQVEKTAFDRCSPGTFAFATRGEAEWFVAKNGGAVRSMEELLAVVNNPTSPDNSNNPNNPTLSPPKAGGDKGGATTGGDKGGPPTGGDKGGATSGGEARP
ncbi:MAG: hypothetical protein LAO06_08150 [Acidobacteriia bacterium]|nr:hypothetical protein [Terriglobia bacterium]